MHRIGHKAGLPVMPGVGQHERRSSAHSFSGVGITVKIRGLLLIISLFCAALQACAEDSRTAEPSTKECPDLTGTYEVRIPAWADKLHPFGRRARIQTKQFATFQRRGGGYTLIWHASRQDFLAAARSLAQRVDQRNPYLYDVWLDRMLRDPKLPLPLGVTGEREWLGRIAGVGPVFRGIDEVLPLKQCKRGWFLIIGPGRRDGPPDFEGGMKGTRQLELWLGRDKDGSINLKAEEHRTQLLLKASMYTPYLAIRLWSSAHLEEKWPVAPRGPHADPRAGAARAHSSFQAHSEVPDHRRPRSTVPPAP
jgi:hypothetical protein